MSGFSPLTESVNASLIQLSKEIEANTLQLPSPPDNIIYLRKLIQSDPSIEAVAEHLRRDPHLSARLIKVANSVLFAGRNHVIDVKSAIIRLGLSKVQNLVTGFAITQQFLNCKLTGIESQLRQSWSKANQVAGICTILARERTQIDSDSALLAGQLHNLGESPLLIHINTMEMCKNNPQLKNAVIDLVCKRLSGKVGAAILKKWHFPTEIIQLPFVETRLAKQQEMRPLDLQSLLYLGIQLHKCNFSRPLTELPAHLKSTPYFTLLWKDEDRAINDLNELASQIHETQIMLSSP